MTSIDIRDPSQALMARLCTGKFIQPQALVECVLRVVGPQDPGLLLGVVQEIP